MPERSEHAVLRWGRPLSARLAGESAAVMSGRGCEPDTLRPPLDRLPARERAPAMDPEAGPGGDVAWFFEEHQFSTERL